MSAAAHDPEATRRRWLVAGASGLAAAVLARIAALAASAPHSTMMYAFQDHTWHLVLSAVVGLLAWSLVFWRWRRPGPAAPLAAVAMLLAAMGLHRLMFQVEFMLAWWPGFWTP